MSKSTSQPSSSRLRVISAMTSAVIGSAWAIVTGIFRGSDTPKSYYAHIKYTAMRMMMPRLSTGDIQSMNPPTGESYKTYILSKHRVPETITLMDGTKAHWIGSSKSDLVVIFFHGGGYVIPALPGHYMAGDAIVELVKKSGKDVGVLFLEYDLAPAHRYPRQLQQGVALIKYTIECLGYKPSKIILAGDSAGGNLCLDVAVHINHPHPSVQRLQLSEPFLGVGLFSPWVTFSQKAPSFTANIRKDMLSPAALEDWSNAYRGNQPTDPYMEPLTAPDDWWKDLAASEIFLTGGADELFINDIEEFATKLQEHFPGFLTKIVSVDSAHDSPLTSVILGKEGPDEQIFAFANLISKRA